MLAATVALFAACSSNDLSESKAPAQQLDDSAVNFSAYVNRGVTRAGAAGTLTTNNAEAPNVSLQEVGFGVFAYYSDSESYSETSKPNFMYNQKVSGADWTYSPLKYWPNEFGKNAASEGQDRLTFFAYAPYVKVNPSTGRIIKSVTDGDNGIVALTSNTASGDPYVKYYADMDPDKRVDLCWGVAKADFTATVDEEAINTIPAGEPYIDVVKPATGSLINFDFKHALAAVNVQIDTDINTEGHSDASDEVDRYTRIWVRSVTFEGFTDKGRLNLNSRATADEGPQWFDLTNESPVASGVVTVFDGRTDGKEGRENATAKKETPATLNAKIIQSAPYSKQALEVDDETARKLTISDAVPGVTKAAVNLFDAIAAEAPVYVIPTDENLKVTIVYDVETYDPSLAAFLSDGAVRGSSVQNTIEKEIIFQNGEENITKLEAGKVYTVKLHLGLTSVKFDASVTEWAEGYGAGIDLPYNYDPNDASHFYTAEEAAAHNAALPGAVHAGDNKLDGNNDPIVYTAETAAAYNAGLTGAVQAGDAIPGTGTPATVAETQEQVDAYNATLPGAISTTDIKTPAVYSFNAFVTANPGTLYAGTVKVIAQTATTTTVEVVTNDVASFVGKQYIVNAVDLTGGTTFELFELNGDPTGLSVQDVTLVSDAVTYTAEEVSAANAQLAGAISIGNDIPGTGTPVETYDEAGAIAFNATLDGAVHVGDNVTYTQAEADAYNAALPGAVNPGDPKQ